jgi:hypothetical protein
MDIRLMEEGSKFCCSVVERLSADGRDTWEECEALEDVRAFNCCFAGKYWYDRFDDESGLRLVLLLVLLARETV